MVLYLNQLVSQRLRLMRKVFNISSNQKNNLCATEGILFDPEGVQMRKYVHTRSLLAAGWRTIAAGIPWTSAKQIFSLLAAPQASESLSAWWHPPFHLQWCEGISYSSCASSCGFPWPRVYVESTCLRGWGSLFGLKGSPRPDFTARLPRHQKTAYFRGILCSNTCSKTVFWLVLCFEEILWVRRS